MQPGYRDDRPPSMDMRRLFEAGELTEYQAEHWFGLRPREELYDIDADPHQIYNLASLPDFRLSCFGIGMFWRIGSMILMTKGNIRKAMCSSARPTSSGKIATFLRTLM